MSGLTFAAEDVRAFAALTPLVRRCHSGEYLALTPPKSVMRFGVVAWSAEEARNNYARSRTAWRELLETALASEDQTP